MRTPQGIKKRHLGKIRYPLSISHTKGNTYGENIGIETGGKDCGRVAKFGVKIPVFKGIVLATVLDIRQV